MWRALPLALALVVAAACAAFAQPAGAAALFASGDAALAAGHAEDALHDCQAAVRLLAGGSPEQIGRAEFCVARAAVAIGRLATAVDAASAAASHIEAGGAPARRYREDLRRARAMVQELGPRVPRLVVVIEPEAARATARVTVNGSALDAALVGSPVALDPGAVTIRVEAEGFRSRTLRLDLEAGSRRTATVSLVSASPTPALQQGAAADAETGIRFVLEGSLLVGAASVPYEVSDGADLLHPSKAAMAVGAGAFVGVGVTESLHLGLRLSGGMFTGFSPGGWFAGGPAFSLGLLGSLRVGLAPIFWVHSDTEWYEYTLFGPGVMGELSFEVLRSARGLALVSLLPTAGFGDEVAIVVPLSIAYRWR